jgi:hypothetical protein
MATSSYFEHHVLFDPASAPEILRQIPALPGVFALYAASPAAEPYLTRAADLRRRIGRLLAPPELAEDGSPIQSKRLNLRNRVHSIAYTVTGSEFAALHLLYQTSTEAFGPEAARKRLRLHPPFCLRLTMEAPHPRVYATNRLSRRGLAHTYGPFPSRTVAERYCDAALDLFKLRRCHEDLDPHPEYPGCAYGEMKKCLAPCNLSCTPVEYAAEAAAVEAFFRTNGESLLKPLAAQRETASADLDFERAGQLHQQHERVRAITGLAADLVRPIPALRAVIVQPAPSTGDAKNLQLAHLYLLESGFLAGPVPLSTLGVRAVREQTAVGSSLFAQPLMLQAIPLGPAHNAETESPESRALAALRTLAELIPNAPDSAEVAAHLSLVRRWFYRPEKSRIGEIFFPGPEGGFPVRRILRAAARLALGEPASIAETNREAAPAAAEAIRQALLAEAPQP